jgi:3-oxosteroid 1-dehydrogenase
MQTDVVVVGSGGAGLMAALSAAVLGARVTVLERAPVFGGTTAISGGGMWLPRNPLGAALGFEDSEEEVMTYLRRVTLGRSPEPLLQGFVRAAPEACALLQRESAHELEGTDTPDYLTGLPGGKVGGRQVASGLYDTARLGELAPLLRRAPTPGGIPALRHSEQQAGGWGIGEHGKDWVALTEERRQTGIVGRGCALVGGLLEACVRHGVQLVHSTRVNELTQSDGRVTGVRAEREGTTDTYAASRGVVLASGGFEWNPTLWDSLVGVPLDHPLSPPFNEGDGLRMAAGAGARLANVNQVWWMPSISLPGLTSEGKPDTRMEGTRGLPGAIVVNRRGRRFMNEAMNYNDAGKAMTAFDPHTYEFANYPSFVILDREHHDTYPRAAFDEQTQATWLSEAPTLRELAGKIGVDPDGLEQQVKDFNVDAEHGRDPVFRRGEYAWETYRGDPRFPNPALRPLGPGPYYGYELRVGCFGTKGGPVIDEQARVVGFDDRPIPGLFAAGNVASAVFGPAYPGGGSTLGAGVTFGFIAGRTAAS